MRRPIAGASAAIIVLVLGLQVSGRAVERIVAVTPSYLVSDPNHFVTEFDVVVDPVNPLRRAVAAIDDDKPGTHLGCVVYVSTDGGQTWRETNPFTLPGADLVFAGDPLIEFGTDGSLHVVCLLGLGYGLGYVNSEDFGVTWSPLVLIPHLNPEQAIDKPSLYVSRAGRVLVCALQYIDEPTLLSSRASTIVSISDDRGATWRTFEPPSFVGYAASCTNFSTDAHGNIFMGFVSLGGPKAGFLSVGTFRSPDNGETWDTPALFGVLTRPSEPAPTDPVNVFLDPNGDIVKTFFPSIEVNRATGSIIGAFGVASADGGHWELYATRSTDAGASYHPVTTPAPPSPVCEKQMYAPTLHPDEGGRLFMEFICNDQLHKSDTSTREVWLTASLNEGATWLPPALLVRETHAPCAIPYVTASVSQSDPCWRWYDGADYWFLSDASDGLHAYWVDYTGGNSSIRSQTFTIDT